MGLSFLLHVFSRSLDRPMAWQPRIELYRRDFLLLRTPSSMRQCDVGTYVPPRHDH